MASLTDLGGTVWRAASGIPILEKSTFPLGVRVGRNPAPVVVLLWVLRLGYCKNFSWFRLLSLRDSSGETSVARRVELILPSLPWDVLQGLKLISSGNLLWEPLRGSVFLDVWILLCRMSNGFYPLLTDTLADCLLWEIPMRNFRPKIPTIANLAGFFWQAQHLPLSIPRKFRFIMTVNFLFCIFRKNLDLTANFR